MATARVTEEHTTMPTWTPIPPRLNISKNIQVTHSSTQHHARSESVVSINPWNHDNLVAASKRFRNLHTYDFTIEAAVSFDGGKTWDPSFLPLHRDWGVDPGLSDPALAWDMHGWVYLVVGPHWNSNDPTDAVGTPPLGPIGIGTWVYISQNGGKSWEQPIKISDNRDDDKQWAASDLTPASPHYGNVYAAWGANTPLHFATSRNPGIAWQGPGGTTPSLSTLAGNTYSPEVSVGPDGTIYIFWHIPKSTSIQLVKSTDGGQSFTAPTNVVTGMTGIHSHAPYDPKGDWPHFPGGKFRVLTLVTGCVVDLNTLIVAWADYRDGVSRIYYRRSTNGGVNWEGPDAGQPLLGAPIVSASTAHEFHPQILALPNGTVGCAFYAFGPVFSPYITVHGGSGVRYLVDVVLVASLDRGVTFSLRESVCDKAWDPAVGAPWAHGDPNVTFIGEYFGLDADQYTFRVVWTDTRTGIQELFYAEAYVQTSITEFEPMLHSDTVFIPTHTEGGVLFDRKTGKVFPIPYPEWTLEALARDRTRAIRDTTIRELARLLEAFTIIEGISDAGAQSARAAILDSIQSIAAQGSRRSQEIPTSRPPTDTGGGGRPMDIIDDITRRPAA
jgi:hypothetical protein